ncbi:UNVERIFIED_CONTAM: hypothetical protein FKN15_064967 [Acipenser sinensis]
MSAGIESILPSWSESAIECRGVCLSYGKLNVLSNLALTVPQGHIYGLLGPSGCGKTTLLRCIVGRLRISKGRITVLGKPPAFPGHGVPGRMVGYMPQDLALYDEFTISDTFWFFGRIHGLTSKETESRISFLIEFLDLPEKSKLVRNLSGGQRRRVSLGAALLQNPQLLILDEPTVGVDPVLRSRIWHHLLEIVKNGQVSVIITTHYIEEARQANVVGLMRNGNLLAEAPPEKLMQQHGALTLESAFLELCQSSDQSASQLHMNAEGAENSEDCDESFLILSGSINQETLESAFLELCQSSDQSASQLHMNAEGAENSEDCDESFLILSGSINQELCFFHSGLERVGKTYFSQVEKYCCSHDKDICPDEENARVFVNQSKAIAGVEDGQYWGIIGFGANFSKYLLLRSLCFQFLLPVIQISLMCLCIGGEPKEIQVAVVNNETDGLFFSQSLLWHLDNSSVHQVFVNQSKAIAGVEDGQYWGIIGFGANFSKYLLLRIMEKQVTEQIVDGGSVHVWLDMTNQQIAFTLQLKLQEAFEFEVPVYGSKNPDFTTFIAPGAIVRCQFPGNYAGSPVFSTLHHGCADNTAPNLRLPRLQGVWIPNEGSLVLIVILIFLQGVTGISMGLVLSSAIDDEQSANQASLGIFFPNLIISDQQIAFTLQLKLQEAFEGFVKDVLGIQSYLASLPVKFEVPVYGSKNPDFTTFIAPGAIVSITFFLAVGLTALSFVMERKQGLLDRCWVAGVSSLETMLAHLFSQLFTMAVQITLLLIFVFLVFKIPNEGSLVLIVILIFLQGVTGISMGLVLSSAIDDEQSANQASLGIFFPNLIISGIIWPIECIPYPLRYLSMALPQTYAAEALRCIMSRVTFVL